MAKRVRHLETVVAVTDARVTAIEKAGARATGLGVAILLSVIVQIIGQYIK